MKTISLGLIVLLMASSSYAQTSPSITVTQELQRQQERERELRRQQEPSPDVRLPREAAPAAAETFPTQETPCFPISQITLTGDEEGRFAFALKAVTGNPDSALGRCLGTQGINVVLTRVQNAIVARGFVTTRVLASSQDLKSGELVLTVIPGKVRGIRFAPDASPRATKWNAVPISSGEILNLRDIEQGLENLKRVPTAEADIQITSAEGADAQPGESDLVIQYQQAFPFRLALSADDSGSKSTGKYQGGLTVSYDNWWTLNDLFYVSLNHGLDKGDDPERGTQGYSAHYSVPYGYWLLGVNTSRNSYYQSVAGASQTYVYSGRSSNSDIKLSRLLYRDAARKTTASFKGWVRSSNNYIDDTEIEVQRRRMAGWEFGFAHREFIGTTTLDMTLGYRRGTGAMRALQAPEEAFDEGTSRLKLITTEVQLNQPFMLAGQQLRYTSTWRGQWNRTPLVPQDRFSIGGRYTVRGFDGETVLSAEHGWLIRNDLGLALGESRQEFYLGADYGEVGGPSSELLLGRRLAGFVLGLRGGYKGLSYDVFAGQPISKPERFVTAHTTAGFSVNWSY